MRLLFAAVVALVSTAAVSANANGLAVANLLKLPNYTGTVWDWSIVAAVSLSSILIFWMARVIGRLLYCWGVNCASAQRWRPRRKLRSCATTAEFEFRIARNRG
jgi:hypothetical protein